MKFTQEQLDEKTYLQGNTLLFTCEGKDLKHALNCVLKGQEFKKKIYPLLKHVLIHLLPNDTRVIATNGKVLVNCPLKTEWSKEEALFLSLSGAKALTRWIKKGKVNVYDSENIYGFAQEGGVRVLEKLPSVFNSAYYRSLKLPTPDVDATFTIGADNVFMLLNCLTEKDVPTRFLLTKDKLRVSSLGVEEIPVEYAGDDVEFALNFEMLKRALDVIKGEVKFVVKEKLPVLMIGDGAQVVICQMTVKR